MTNTTDDFDLRYIFSECFANEEATILLNSLFPKRYSQPVALG